jgi:hypothetical protein
MANPELIFNKFGNSKQHNVLIAYCLLLMLHLAQIGQENVDSVERNLLRPLRKL